MSRRRAAPSAWSATSSRVLLAPYDLPDSTLVAFTRLFLGAVSATGSSVSLAADPQQASDDAEGAIVLVLAGIRSLLDSAEQAPTATDLAPGLDPRSS